MHTKSVLNVKNNINTLTLTQKLYFIAMYVFIEL